MSTPDAAPPPHFLRALVAADQARGAYGGRVVTRFPPEPNGYLHIGHAKSICLNFGLAAEFGGVCHLRYDDTNPTTESVEYVDAILEYVKWLGFDPAEKVFFASDYFGKIYDYAVRLVMKGKAYVCDLSDEQIREYRGSTTEPGRPSPWRERSVAENLRLLEGMKNGEFPEGSRVLRAKIDMADPNFKMRDPLLYRIRFAHHYRTGDTWKIYPFYDFAHCLSDAIEGITHSICTLEFENNRELYDWLLRECEIVDPPHQHEFARLNLTWTVMSKRRFLRLVNEGHVSGWDDPRMPTLAGLRRRGVTPEALRALAERVGVAKANSVVEVELFEGILRDDLNLRAPRGMAVARPLKVVLTDWEADRRVEIEAPLFPTELGLPGRRTLTLGRELWIEATDFSEHPPKGWKRLSPGGEVRLRYGCVIRCDEVVKDAEGNVVELRCTHDPATFGGAQPEGRKVRGIVHWVNTATALPAELRLYDRLVSVEKPTGDDFLAELNPRSLEVLRGYVEPAILATDSPAHWQFERQGYFFRDPVEAAGGRVVFNRTVGLREGWTAEGDTPAPADTKVPAPVAPVPQEPQAARALAPEVEARRAALVARFGIADAPARVIAAEADLVALFEAAAACAPAAAVAPFLANVVVGELRQGGREVKQVPGAAIGRIVALTEAGTLGATQARRVLTLLLERGGDPDTIVAAEGLARVDDPAAIAAWVAAALEAHPAEVARLRAGQSSLAGFFVGKVLKLSGGRADAAAVQRAVAAALAG
jgi:glutaminyl-tRNA synthetase